GTLPYQAQCTQQVRFQRLRGALHSARATQLDELRHLQSLVTTRVDPLKRLEIEIHIQREAVITAVPADANSNTTEFFARNINAGRAAARLGRDSEFERKPDDALLQSSHDVAHTQLRAPQVHERIHHQLAGTVVGDLSATIDLHHRDIAR